MFGGEDVKTEALETLCPTEYEPFKGVREDLDSILKAFENTSNVRYETFNQLWLDMQFDKFYAGRQNERECRELSEECLRIVAESWNTNSGLHTKVGLFYLMYGLYFTQPIEPKSKIRITLPVWKDMNCFVGEVKLQKHLDIEYVFHTLRYHQAFHFVASTAWPSVQYRSQSNTALNPDDQSAFKEPSMVAEIVHPDHIDQLSSIHEHYHRLKCRMSAINGGFPDRPQASLNVIQTNLVQVITKTVTQHDVWRKTQGRKKIGRKRKDSGQTTTSESDMDSDSDYGLSPGRRSPKNRKSQWGIRAEIKDRAQKMVSVPNRGRKSTLADDSDTMGSPMSSATTPKKRRGRTPKDGSQTDEDIFSMTEATPIKQEALLSMPALQDDEEEDAKVLNLGGATQVPSLAQTPTPSGRGKGKGRGKRTPGPRQMTTPRGRGRKKKEPEPEEPMEKFEAMEKDEVEMIEDGNKSKPKLKEEDGTQKKKGRGRAKKTAETPVKTPVKGKAKKQSKKKSETSNNIVDTDEGTPAKSLTRKTRGKRVAALKEEESEDDGIQRWTVIKDTSKAAGKGKGEKKTAKSSRASKKSKAAEKVNESQFEDVEEMKSEEEVKTEEDDAKEEDVWEEDEN